VVAATAGLTLAPSSVTARAAPANLASGTWPAMRALGHLFDRFERRHAVRAALRVATRPACTWALVTTITTGGSPGRASAARSPLRAPLAGSRPTHDHHDDTKPSPATSNSNASSDRQGGRMDAEQVIVAEGVGKRFGTVQALAGVDLAVPAGGVLGLLGPNGAGKTTLVRILATLLRPDEGRAWVSGLDVARRPSAVRRLIGLSGQYAAVDAFLTGRENLRMIGRLAGLGRAAARRRADELLKLFDLAGAADRTARTYSAGMRRRLDVAASLVARPAVVFLDEPTTGLDPRGRLGLWRHLRELTGQGTTLLLTTQYLEEADRLADQLVVLDHGRVIATGTAASLKARVGGDRLEVQALPGADPAPLAAALAGLGSGPPAVDGEVGRVVLPVADGPAILPEVAARLATSGLLVADLAVRRPTLDDVFLALTGQPTVAAGHDASPDPAAKTGTAPRPQPERRPP
jgi:ABC-2 type transport system ATP-binding protein